LQRGCFIQHDGFEAERMGSWKHRSRSRSVAFGTSCPFKCCGLASGFRFRQHNHYHRGYFGGGCGSWGGFD